MIGRKMLIAAVGATMLAVPALAAEPVGKHEEKKIALSEVPKAALDGAKSQLASVTSAEQVTAKDGRMLYELKGKTKAGKMMELFVTPEGQVMGPESKMEHKMEHKAKY